MNSIFSTDGKLYRLMTFLTDLVALNLVYLITCLPLVTIGAATTALYSVCYEKRAGNDGPVLRAFFRAFAANWKQATGLWIPMAIILCSCLFDLILLRSSGILRYVGTFLVSMILTLDFGMLTAVFPLLSLSSTAWKQTLKNALFLTLGRLPFVLLLAVLEAVPALILMIMPGLFLKLLCLWGLIWYAAAAYVGTILLKIPAGKA